MFTHIIRFATRFPKSVIVARALVEAGRGSSRRTCAIGVGGRGSARAGQRATPKAPTTR
jgi:hypothetical protein